MTTRLPRGATTLHREPADSDEGAFDWDPSRPLAEQWPWNGAASDIADALVIPADAPEAGEETSPMSDPADEHPYDVADSAESMLEDDDAISDHDTADAIEAQERPGAFNELNDHPNDPASGES